MKNTVLTYFVLMALVGMVTLSVLGASMVQKNDGRGLVVLALVVGGLLLTFIYGLTADRRGRAQRASASRPPRYKTVTVSSSAEFPHPPSAVWALIRPAESALSLTDGVYHAVSVPPLPDGPGELQCFFHRNGDIGAIEVVQEIPEQLAVTRPVLPAGDVQTQTTYRLEIAPRGAKLTVESEFEVPEPAVMNEDMCRLYWDKHFGEIRVLLDRQAVIERGL
ncbi:hypothetical protein ACIQTZ_09060 [Paenarthrobacter sp. NPDC090520]|uniref:hypothetical protein n=1 Tax=Paenarthrobacter sp. NPDC090520 TaxID=3364382 RepID=UPI00380225C8